MRQSSVPGAETLERGSNFLMQELLLGTHGNEDKANNRGGEMSWVKRQIA